MAQIDQREVEATNLFNERYVMNAKKPRLKKIFNREKMEQKVETMFDNEYSEKIEKQKKRRLELRKRAQKAFM